MHSFYLDAIRKFEGYTAQATWDYAQHSNGYGTKAQFPGEVISKGEAERRFQAEVGTARQIVEKHASHLDEGTKAALTSLTYNAGTAWIESGLGDAVRQGDLAQVREIFQKYNKAGGEVLPGLVSRRAQEALWIGNPDMVAGAAASQSPVVTAALESAAAESVLPAVEPTPRLVDLPRTLPAPPARDTIPVREIDTEREPAQALLQALAARSSQVEPSTHAASIALSIDGLLRASGADMSLQGTESKAVELARLVRLESGLELRSSKGPRNQDSRSII